MRLSQASQTDGGKYPEAEAAPRQVREEAQGPVNPRFLNHPILLFTLDMLHRVGREG